jgi:hypothetical protein
MASPIKGYTTAADAVVRAGTNGMFYFGGIAFNRDDQQKGVLFVALFAEQLTDRESLIMNRGDGVNSRRRRERYPPPS